MLDRESRYLLDNVSVIVIDDNPHMRSLILSILHSLGVEKISDSGDAQEGYQRLQNFQADVLIVDWDMKPMSGLDFANMVRKDEDSPNPYVPIIMLSGATEYEHVLQARDAGVNEFVVKPLSAKTLFDRITSIIDNPRPFVKNEHYFGPCRRRRDLGPPEGIQERRADETVKKAVGQD